MPVQCLQVEEPGCVKREIQGCIVAADDYQVSLAILAACCPADMGGRCLRRQAPGVLPDVIAINLRKRVALARVARSAQQEDIAARIPGELDIPCSDGQLCQAMPEAGRDIITIPAGAGMCGRYAGGEEALGQVEMPLLICQH